jgi:sugar phosphate permease
VAEQDSGVASSLLNTAQQVGGAIGLALLGTVAWTAVADSVRTQAAHAAAAAFALLAVVIAIVTIRVSCQELGGAVPAPQEAAPQSAAPQPGTVQQHEDRAALAAAVRPCRLC